jgi:hypothetical protein
MDPGQIKGLTGSERDVRHRHPLVHGCLGFVSLALVQGRIELERNNSTRPRVGSKHCRLGWSRDEGDHHRDPDQGERARCVVSFARPSCLHNRSDHGHTCQSAHVFSGSNMFYWSVTNTSTRPVPSFNAVMALPMIAPCARSDLPTFMAWPGRSLVVNKSPGRIAPCDASAFT